MDGAGPVDAEVCAVCALRETAPGEPAATIALFNALAAYGRTALGAGHAGLPACGIAMGDDGEMLDPLGDKGICGGTLRMACHAKAEGAKTVELRPTYSCGATRYVAIMRMIFSRGRCTVRVTDGIPFGSLEADAVPNVRFSTMHGLDVAEARASAVPKAAECTNVLVCAGDMDPTMSLN